MDRQWVSGLSEGARVDELFAVTGMAPATTKNGDLYLRLKLSDRTGTLEARVWEPILAARLLAEVGEGEVAAVRGMVEKYRDQLQINVEGCTKPEGEQDLTCFLLTSPRETTAMLTELYSRIAGIDDYHLRTLLQHLFSGESVEKFARMPAGRRIHHAYLGGLLEHSLEVAGYCGLIAEHHPGVINTPLLLTGALIHDIGKTEEYVCSVGFPQTDRGLLLGGHLVLGRDILREALKELPDFPESLALALEHMILSHHGTREWGAVEEPRTVEAVALHHADLASGKVAQAASVLERHQGNGGWTAYDYLLKRNLWSGIPNRGAETG